MTDITVQFKGLTGILGQVIIDDTLKLGDLIEAIATAEGLPIDYYSISVEGNPGINDRSYDDSTTIIGGSLPAGAEITENTRIICTTQQRGNKERRQIQKLEIAQKKRTGGLASDSTQGNYYRPLNTYNRDRLGAKYIGNSVVDNPNPGGLQPGRPWT